MQRNPKALTISAVTLGLVLPGLVWADLSSPAAPSDSIVKIAPTDPEDAPSDIPVPEPDPAEGDRADTDPDQPDAKDKDKEVTDPVLSEDADAPAMEKVIAAPDPDTDGVHPFSLMFAGGAEPQATMRFGDVAAVSYSIDGQHGVIFKCGKDAGARVFDWPQCGHLRPEDLAALAKMHDAVSALQGYTALDLYPAWFEEPLAERDQDIMVYYTRTLRVVIAHKFEDGQRVSYAELRKMDRAVVDESIYTEVFDNPD